MNKYILGATFSLALLLSPVATQAAGLTSLQIQAILSLLSSFGADSTTIANVNASLTGGTPTGTTPSAPIVMPPAQSYCHSFNIDFAAGGAGTDAAALEQALNYSGVSTVVAFQAKYGIRQTGYAGPATRAKLNALSRCAALQQSTSPSSTGQSASIDQSSLAIPNNSVQLTITGSASNVNTVSLTVLDPSGAIAGYNDGRGGFVTNGRWSVNLSAIPQGTYTIQVRDNDTKKLLTTGTFQYGSLSNAPTLSFSATTPVAYGKTSTLTWTSTNATACAYGPTGGGLPLTLSGTDTTNPIVTNTIYIYCTGPGGAIAKSVTIVVTAY